MGCSAGQSPRVLHRLKIHCVDASQVFPFISFHDQLRFFVESGIVRLIPMNVYLIIETDTVLLREGRQ